MVAGWKAWTTEVLSATEMQGYIQDQVVAQFASASQRDAVLVAPKQGQCVYLEDSDELLYREGSMWRPVSSRWPNHTSGVLPSTGVRDGETIYSSAYQCAMIRTFDGWRQASIAMSTGQSLTAYVAWLTDKGIGTLHNGFQYYDADSDKLWVSTRSDILSFMLLDEPMTARVTTGFDTTGVSGWAYDGTATWGRRVGGGMAHLYVQVVKTTAVQNVSISGEFTNVKIGNVPTAFLPADTAPLSSGAFGRVATGYLQADGSVSLAAVSPGAGIVIGEVISLGGAYRLASNEVSF